MGIFGLVKSVVGLAENVVDIAIAPVEVVVDVTRMATKPIAEGLEELTEDVKQMVDE